MSRRKAALAATIAGVSLATVAAINEKPASAQGAPTQAPIEQRLRSQLALERAQHAHEVKALRSQLASRTSIRSAIRTAAVTYSVPESQIRSVAWCESRMRATAIGRTPVGSERAVGLMQWLPSSFSRTPYGRAGLNPFDPYVSALAAAETVRKEGWRAWACKP